MLKKIFIALITVLLMSCNGQNGVSKDDAVKFMEEYYENSKTNDFGSIESFYSEDINGEELEDLYNKIHSVVGTITSIKLESWNVKSYLGTSGSGKYFTLVYNNEYENGIVKETITLFAPRGKNEVKITGHNYNSDAFLKF